MPIRGSGGSGKGRGLPQIWPPKGLKWWSSTFHHIVVVFWFRDPGIQLVVVLNLISIYNCLVVIPYKKPKSTRCVFFIAHWSFFGCFFWGNFFIGPKPGGWMCWTWFPARDHQDDMLENLEPDPFLLALGGIDDPLKDTGNSWNPKILI